MHLIQTQIDIQAPGGKESSGKQEYCNSLQTHLFHIQMLVHKYLTRVQLHLNFNIWPSVNSKHYNHLLQWKIQWFPRDGTLKSQTLDDSQCLLIWRKFNFMVFFPRPLDCIPDFITWENYVKRTQNHLPWDMENGQTEEVPWWEAETGLVSSNLIFLQGAA